MAQQGAREVIALRGGGDIATGVAQKLHRAGFFVVILEAPQPTAIRRTVALSEAVYSGRATVEDLTARLVATPEACEGAWGAGEIPVLVDPAGESLGALGPQGLVDAILAKDNLGTHPKMAPVVIALGPGFSAPRDAHAVVETMRGHHLGRVYFAGAALPNTGLPGVIGGQGALRVLRAPCGGSVRHHCAIGDLVEEGQPVFSVGNQTVTAPFPGLVRGLIREGLTLPRGMKTADIDPRPDSDWKSISDKARCVGGGVLEAYLYLRRKQP